MPTLTPSPLLQQSIPLTGNPPLSFLHQKPMRKHLLTEISLQQVVPRQVGLFHQLLISRAIYEYIYSNVFATFMKLFHLLMDLIWSLPKRNKKSLVLVMGFDFALLTSYELSLLLFHRLLGQRPETSYPLHSKLQELHVCNDSPSPLKSHEGWGWVTGETQRLAILHFIAGTKQDCSLSWRETLFIPQGCLLQTSPGAVAQVQSGQGLALLAYPTGPVGLMEEYLSQ